MSCVLGKQKEDGRDLDIKDTRNNSKNNKNDYTDLEY